MFRVSLLKLHRGPSLTTIDTIPQLQLDNHPVHPVVESLSLLDWKWNHDTTPPSRMVLVQWKGLAPEDTSWEDWATLQSDYDLEDEADFPGEGVDRNNIRDNNRLGRVIRRPTHLRDFV